MFLALFAFAVDRIASSGRVGNNVMIDGIDVSGMSRAEAEAALEAHTSQLLVRPITVTAAEKTLQLDAAKLGARAEVEQAVDAAIQVRSSWNPLAWLASWFATANVEVSGVKMDPDTVRDVLTPAIADVMTPPKDATFDTSDPKNVKVVPAVDGRGLDVDAAVDAMRSALLARRDADRRTTIPLAAIPPEFTTEQAEAYGITEELGVFTTNFPAGEERVKNIQLMSEMLNDTLVKPGERFSANEAVGPRTEEKGFVKAPVIYDYEFSEDVGGGVSQVATTMFNAAFFAGVPIKEFKAHSFWIPRYPLGREATLSFPYPDLVWVNNYESNVLIRATVQPTSVTVGLYGTSDGRTVEESTGPKTNPTAPKISCRLDTELKPGTEKVRQRPAPGYSVVVKRTVKWPDGKTDQTNFTTVYSPKDRVIGYNPASKPSTSDDDDGDSDSSSSTTKSKSKSTTTTTKSASGAPGGLRSEPVSARVGLRAAVCPGANGRPAN